MNFDVNSIIFYDIVAVANATIAASRSSSWFEYLLISETFIIKREKGIEKH